MNINILRSKMPANAKLVQEVEIVLGVKLPKSYLNFVALHNGGEPQPNIFEIGATGNQSGINEFVALDDVIQESRLGNFDAVPGFIPFALAEGGNYICICISEDVGRVFFWDHELEPSEGGLVLLANSINEFLEEVMPFNAVETQLQPNQVISAWIDPDLLK